MSSDEQRAISSIVMTPTTDNQELQLQHGPTEENQIPGTDRRLSGLY